MPTPLDDQRKEILAACMDAWERGDQADVDRACREWPDLAPEIRAAAQVMAELQAARGEPPAAAAGRVPEVVGRYRILGELGRGGMGVVYRAHDPVLDREVALKVQPGLNGSPRAAERFRREARVLAQMRHPHIVGIHDIGETVEGLQYFAMDLVEGKSLRQILSVAVVTNLRALRAEHLLPESHGATNTDKGSYLEAAARLLIKVADALQHSHQEGITHRDIKPSNLLVDCAGEPHLVDFGIAREKDAVATSPDTLAAAGTPEYMAPEQITENGTIGPWTDVYALGVVLYELITQQRPFAAATNQQVLRRILEFEPRSPRKLNPMVSRDLETICLAALEKDPRRRYASPRAFGEDLTRLLATQPIRARSPGLIARLVKFLRRNPWPTALAGAAIVAATGGVIGQQVRASWNRDLAQRHIALAHEQVMGLSLGPEPALSSAVEHLRKANALDPDQPGRELIEAIERIQLAREVEAQADLELDHCRELRRNGGSSKEIEERTRRVLVQLNELALKAPDAEALDRNFPRVLQERSLVMRPGPDSMDAEARAFDAQAEAAGKGTIALIGLPDGARVHLFHYQECTRRGPVRLVPMPFHFSEPVAQGELQPGDRALVVERVAADGPAAGEGIRAGDLILESSGRLPTFDSLIRPPAGGLDLRILSDGRLRAVTLRDDRASGIQAVATGYPLPCSPSNRMVGPPVRVAVLPGSYLVLLRSDRREDLRLPLQLKRAGERVTLRADCQPEGNGPRGFVFIAPGDFSAGGGGTQRPEESRWLDEYWIGREEVACLDYLEFLQDPRTRADIERSIKNVQWIRVPRVRCEIPGIHRPLWKARPDGTYELDRDPHLPVSSISCEDCEAYCRWLTDRAAERNEPWLFRLPTEDEWEKAARSVDGRAFPWGATFDRSLCWLTCPVPANRPVGQPSGSRPLDDESPFGVRDMAGGVLEWCAGTYLGTPQRPWRSGVWGNTDADSSRCASSHGGLPRRIGENDGFRLVAVRRK